jgi:alkanesulfonate monooxygenase SsuD/methylene tetrahydromethanopterin reductase-like flavin-dependent oxidoreductase (luciferase family)
MRSTRLISRIAVRSQRQDGDVLKFSMIFEAQLANPTPEREHETIRDCVEQAVLGEQMGFDRVWAVEHHGLYWYAHMSAPEVFLSWVAAKTSRIRIGHGVVCMPFGYNHPVRVAERAAMLDVLSGGRLDLGAGRGSTFEEMSFMGVDPDMTVAQVEEALRMISCMWLEDDFEWHGLLDIPPHKVLPRPIQQPHPPLYLACTTTDSVVRAGEYGVGALVFGFGGPDDVANLRKIYDEAIAARSEDKLVSTVQNTHLGALCPSIVLDDPVQALQIGARGQRFMAESVLHWYAHAEPPDQEVSDGDHLTEIEGSKGRWIAYLHEAKIPVNPASYTTFNVDHAYGDTKRAIEYVEALEDAGVDEVMLFTQMGTIPQWACMETIRQWGETVIPYFRAREG